MIIIYTCVSHEVSQMSTEIGCLYHWFYLFDYINTVHHSTEQKIYFFWDYENKKLLFEGLSWGEQIVTADLFSLADAEGIKRLSADTTPSGGHHGGPVASRDRKWRQPHCLPWLGCRWIWGEWRNYFLTYFWRLRNLSLSVFQSMYYLHGLFMVLGEVADFRTKVAPYMPGHKGNAR